MTTTQTGNTAETLAADHLTRQGLKIIARNVRCRGGEVDLIAEHRGTVVFVEVRLRKSQRFGGAAESITATKQARIVLAATHWLNGAGRAQADRPCRFDVVLMDGLSSSKIEWIPDAFSAD
jgi:putative endonuclease